MNTYINLIYHEEILFVWVFWGLFLPVMGAEGNEPTEMTASIKNPSFEEGLNGWEAIGFQKQTNNSPSDEGWNKDGTVYAEKWVSSSWTLPDVKLSQTVTGLPQGSYTVKVYAHAVNQSGNPEITKGVSFCRIERGTSRCRW